MCREHVPLLLSCWLFSEIGGKIFEIRNNAILIPPNTPHTLIKQKGEFLKIYCEQTDTNYISESIVQQALNNPTSQEDLLVCFNKTDIYPFKINLKFISFIFNLANQFN